MDVAESNQRVLIAEDEEWARAYLKGLLDDETGLTVDEAEDGTKAVELINRNVYDLVITDLNMEGVDGIGVLKAAKAQLHDPEVLLVTGYAAVDSAVEALKLGAIDYLTKPLDSKRVRLSIRQALEKKKLKQEVAFLRDRLKQTEGATEVVAVSSAMQKVLSVVELVARSDASVIIEGENGTGKEVIARAIHEASSRRDGPFVAVNCGALPESLMESELFGHVKGAFTGADRDKRGFFEEASGGTLLLDEIGDLPLQLQVKLLRVLQEGTINRVGSTKETPISARIISASNRDIRQMVAEGTFREDLFFRLHVVPLIVPPLRDRRDDILPLCKMFLAKYGDGNGGEEKTLAPEVIAMFYDYEWPGNVRELENLIRGAVAISPTYVVTKDIISSLLNPGRATESQVRETEDSQSISSVQNVVEREHIINVLKEHGGNQGKAAGQLGISRTTLWRKMKKYEIASSDGPAADQ